MITYLYWIAVVVASLSVLWGVGFYFKKIKVGIIASLLVLLVGWGMFEFSYEQHFVKHWGGVMSIVVPEGQLHIQVTWKDDNLWVENYDPKENRCYFTEYSKGSILEGTVTIKDCNPLAYTAK